MSVLLLVLMNMEPLVDLFVLKFSMALKGEVLSADLHDGCIKRSKLITRRYPFDVFLSSLV